MRHRTTGVIARSANQRRLWPGCWPVIGWRWLQVESMFIINVGVTMVPATWTHTEPRQMAACLHMDTRHCIPDTEAAERLWISFYPNTVHFFLFSFGQHIILWIFTALSPTHYTTMMSSKIKCQATPPIHQSMVYRDPTLKHWTFFYKYYIYMQLPSSAKCISS